MKTLDKTFTDSEITLISLCCTNQARAYYAQPVLSRRAVVLDGTVGIRRYFKQGGIIARPRPWVREVFFAVNNEQGSQHNYALLAPAMPSTGDLKNVKAL